MKTELYFNAASLMQTSTERVLGAAAQAGFDGIEARAERLCGHPAEVTEAAKAIKAGAGKVWSLNGLRLPLDPDGKLNFATLEADLAEHLHITAMLGAPYLLVVPPRMSGLSFQAALPGLHEGLARATHSAASHGIKLAFEFLGFADCPVRTLAHATEVVAPISKVGLVIDTCHLYASGSKISDAPLKRLAMVHVNDVRKMPHESIEDADRLLPGEGCIPLKEYVQELREKGYLGPWSVETFNQKHWASAPEELCQKAFKAMEALFK